MSVYWDRRRLRNVRKLSLLSFPKSTILSKTTKPTFPSRDEKIERIGYRCATEGIEKCYYAPVKNPLRTRNCSLAEPKAIFEVLRKLMLLIVLWL